MSSYTSMSPAQRRRMMKRRRALMMRRRRAMRNRQSSSRGRSMQGRRSMRQGGGKIRRRTQGMSAMKRFGRLVKRYIKATQAGNTNRAARLERRIQRMCQRKPQLKMTRAYRAFIRARGYTTGQAAPQSMSAIPETYSPQFDQSAADSAEGEVIDYPDEYEDLPDEDEDYEMDGYGQFGMMQNVDKMTKFYVAGGLGLLAFGQFTKQTKKNKKMISNVGLAAVGVGVLTHFFKAKKNEAAMGLLGAMHENPHCMNGYGELEIMDGFGELEIMDGFGAMHENPMHYASQGMSGNAAAFGGYGELEIMDGF